MLFRSNLRALGMGALPAAIVSRLRTAFQVPGSPAVNPEKALFEPAHDVLPQVAEHFVARMGKVTWLIATPDASVMWDGITLHNTGPLVNSAADLVDSGEALIQDPVAQARAQGGLPHPAIALPLAMFGADFGYEYIFSRYLEAVGQKGDVLLGISTSGNSGTARMRPLSPTFCRKPPTVVAMAVG